MFLTDTDIINIGPSVIKNFDPSKVQPTSYDCSLAADLLIPDNYNPKSIDLRYTDISKYFTKYTMTDIIPNGSSYTLRSGKAVLGSTVEYMTLPADLHLELEGKSTLARTFLVPHVACGGIVPGFHGTITLEIVNVGPFDVVLYPGMPIAQLRFIQLSKPVAVPYGSPSLGSRYQHQSGPTTYRK
jgi:dCTP deaminase